jgi:hypothetical protein
VFCQTYIEYKSVSHRWFWNFTWHEHIINKHTSGFNGKTWSTALLQWWGQCLTLIWSLFIIYVTKTICMFGNFLIKKNLIKKTRINRWIAGLSVFTDSLPVFRFLVWFLYAAVLLATQTGHRSDSRLNRPDRSGFHYLGVKRIENQMPRRIYIIIPRTNLCFDELSKD